MTTPTTKALEALRSCVAALGEEHDGTNFEVECQICHAYREAKEAIAALESEVSQQADPSMQALAAGAHYHQITGFADQRMLAAMNATGAQQAEAGKDAARSEQKGEPGVKESLTAQADRRELVNIVWNNPDSDWPWFYMLDTKPGWVKLKGADYPDGTAKHRGDVFWAPESAIKAMSATE